MDYSYFNHIQIVVLFCIQSYKLDVKYGKDEISQIVKKKLISKEKCNIKLLLLLGYHSYDLAKIFEPYVESIICIHP